MTCHYPDLVSAVIGWKIASTNQKHYPDLGSDTSSVWNFCARFSDVISRENQWWRHEMTAVFTGKWLFLFHFFLSGDSSAAAGSVGRTGKSQGANSGVCQTSGTGRRTASWEGQFTYLIRTRIGHLVARARDSLGVIELYYGTVFGTLFFLLLAVTKSRGKLGQNWTPKNNPRMQFDTRMTQSHAQPLNGQ